MSTDPSSSSGDMLVDTPSSVSCCIPDPTPSARRRLTDLPAEVINMIFDLVANDDGLSSCHPLQAPSYRQAMSPYDPQGTDYVALQRSAVDRRHQAAWDAGQFRLTCRSINAMVFDNYLAHSFSRIAIFMSMSSLSRLVSITEDVRYARAIKGLYVCSIAYGGFHVDKRRPGWRNLVRLNSAHAQFRGSNASALLEVVLRRLSPTFRGLFLVEHRLDLPSGTNLLAWGKVERALENVAYDDWTYEPRVEPDVFWLHLARALATIELPNSRVLERGEIAGLRVSICDHLNSDGIMDRRAQRHYAQGLASSWKVVDTGSPSLLTVIKKLSINLANSAYNQRVLAATIRPMTGLEELNVTCRDRIGNGRSAPVLETLVLACPAERIKVFSLSDMTIRPSRLSRCLRSFTNIEVLKLESVNLCNEVGSDVLADETWATILRNVTEQCERLEHVHLALLRHCNRRVHMFTTDEADSYMASDSCLWPDIVHEELRQIPPMTGQYICLRSRMDIKTRLVDVLSGLSVGVDIVPGWNDNDRFLDDDMMEGDEINPRIGIRPVW